MKKVVSILFSLILVICISFAFGGCGNQTIKVNGKFYSLEAAYNYGWLDESDLKSIACSYYDSHSYQFEENPYSGMYTSFEELNKKMETEIKQAYLEQIVEFAAGDRDRVDIVRYYGTYNGNVVINIRSNYIFFDHIIEAEVLIGGVIFKNYWSGDFRVYHID